MSDNKKNEDKSDITRIEDLSEYLHDEDEEIEGLDSFSGMDDAELMDAKTDPNIELPPEFTQSFQAPEETNFEELESEDSFDSFNDAPPSLPDEDDASQDDTSFEDNSFGVDSESDFQEPDFNEGTASFDSDNFEQDSFESNDFDSNDFSSEQTPEDDEFSFDDSNDSVDEKDEEENIQDSPETSEDSFDLYDEQDDSVAAEEETVEPTLDTPSEAVPETVKTPIIHEEVQSYRPSENFQELQKFAKNITYGNLATEGTPPFSIILKDIKYQEDIDDIIALLKEFKIITSDEEDASARKSLARGNMLIPRLGEFSAITICHKLRRYDLNILMGLTEEINPPKEYESDDSGIVSKHSVYNSRSHHYKLDKDKLDASEIIVSTTPYLEGHDIIEYIGIASENTVIDTQLLQRSHKLEEELIGKLPNYQQDKQRLKQIERENAMAANSGHHESIFEQDHNSNNHSEITLKDIHVDLVAKLKNQASEQKGNAIIGVNFHVSPLTNNPVLDTLDQYQVTCSGSVVWINKR
ncbi:MAG: hypothetical protein KC478_09045 [Bacteriovoracaceae bacterium]|nr:hypothetical protein [Bacteriovoracaceae bacterium]